MANQSDSKPRLDYATPGVPPSWDTRLKSAMLCGAIPLLSGISAAIGAVVTGHVIFAVIGLMILGFGLFLFFYGLMDLIGFVREQRFRFGRLDNRVRIRVGLILLLLISNFPAALICLGVGARAYYTLNIAG